MWYKKKLNLLKKNRTNQECTNNSHFFLTKMLKDKSKENGG